MAISHPPARANFASFHNNWQYLTFTVLSILLIITGQVNSTPSGEETTRQLPSPNQRISLLSNTLRKHANSISDSASYQTLSKSSHPAKELNVDYSTDDDEILGIEDHQLAKLDANTNVFTNQFVIESEGGPERIKKIAHDHGFEYLGHVSALMQILFKASFFPPTHLE